MRNVSMTIWVMVVCVMAMANIASADIFGSGSNQFTIDFVTISGDASSANGRSTGPYKGFTDPGDFRIGAYEITNDQWNKFVNASGTVTGNPSNAYDESAYWTGTDIPTNELSWYEAAQFVNWLNTSTGHQPAYKFTGTQSQSDYTFVPWDIADTGYDASNPYRNSEAFYFLPTDDEWVKAAYWNGIFLQSYATRAGETLHKGDGVSGTGWNYDLATHPYGPWDVGSGSEELNGTFDMMGNVWEWMESPYYLGDYLSASERGARGGGYYLDFDYAPTLRGRYFFGASTDNHVLGFRIASIPEPALVVAVDIKPGSCPNPVNVKSSGMLPIAILGTDDYDVTTIDPTSVRLAGVEPLRSGYEDVAGPVSDSNDCNCITDGPDGFLDLTLKFKTQRIVEAVGDVNDGDVLTLELTGVLYDETPIEGADCILIRGRHKPINPADINKDGVVNAADFAIFAQNWLQSSIVDE